MIALTKWKLEKILSQSVWLTRRKIQLCKHLGSKPYTVEEILVEIGHLVTEQNGLMDILLFNQEFKFCPFCSSFLLHVCQACKLGNVSVT